MISQSKPLVSIIVPSYNQGQYIKDTIASILGQDYPNLEIIVMDGGSTDDTLGVLAQFEGKLLLISGPDNGQTDAINKGFSKAQGDIVAWLNSDDVYLFDDTVSYMVDRFEQKPNVDVLFGDYVRIDESNNFLKPYHVWKSYSFERLMRVCYISQPTVFFRKYTIEKCPLDDSLNFGMDIDLWLKLGDMGFCIEHCGRFVAAERIHDNAKTVALRHESIEEGIFLRKKYTSIVGSENILKQNMLDKMGFAFFRLKSLYTSLRFKFRRDTLVAFRYESMIKTLISQLIRAK